MAHPDISACGGVHIGPSVLCADLSQLYNESQQLIDGGANYIHLDVMDGHFVPNISFGHAVIKCLRKRLPRPFFESHMMVSKPEQWIEAHADAGVNQYTFHVEPVSDVLDVCRKVREAGMRVGLAIKPGTPTSVIAEYTELADLVLVMTVEPGFGGQKFMSGMLEKVKWLREKNPSLDIEVDGGVGLSNVEQCAKAGANWIVAGTAVTGAPDRGAVIRELKTIGDAHLTFTPPHDAVMTMVL